MNNYLNLQPTNNYTPELLKTMKQWVLRDENKIPYNPNEPTTKASVSNPDTWATYDVARVTLNNSPHCVGLGFVLTEEDDIVVIDLDHCMDENGEITPFAQEVLSTIGNDTYMEVSQSGTGIHIFLRGKKNTNLSKKGDIEVYEEKRYIAMTFNAICTSEPSDKQTELNDICDRYLNNAYNVSINASITVNNLPPHLTGASIIALIKAEGNPKFLDLINGKWEAHYKTRSEADLALCQKINYYAKKDVILIRETMLLTAMRRDKWDREDYLDRTIRNAISSFNALNNSFSLTSMRELMEKDLEEPYSIIDNYLVEGVTLLSALPKSGKSFFATQLGVSVATGTDFLGHPTNQCGVLYLDFEASETLQQKRLKNQFKDNTPPDNFYYCKTENIPQIGDGFCEYIETLLKKYKDIKLIIVDMLTHITKVSKNNDYKAVYDEISPLKSLASKYHISIVLLKHNTKQENENNIFCSSVGSIANIGSVDTIMILSRVKGTLSKYKLSVTSRNFASFEDTLSFENAIWTPCVLPPDVSEINDRHFLLTVAKLIESGTYKGKAQAILNEAEEFGFSINLSSVSFGKQFEHFKEVLESNGISANKTISGNDTFYTFYK